MLENCYIRTGVRHINMKISPLNTRFCHLLTLLVISLGVNQLFSNDTLYLRSVRFSQKIDITAHQGKTFQLQAAVKMVDMAPEKEKIYVHLWARVQKIDGKRGFFENMNDRPITNPDWNIYQIDGTLDEDGQYLTIGGIAGKWGKFYFDAFQLQVEVEKDQWETIPLSNPGFEKAMVGADSLSGWQGTYNKTAGFSVQLDETTPYAGKQALLIERIPQVPQYSSPTTLKSALIFDDISQVAGPANFFTVALHQDKNGFIWLGTGDGLIRFDGYNYKVYKNDDSDSLSLSDNSITAIFEGKDGMLWIGTQSGGINQFDPKTETFQRFVHNSDDSLSLSSNGVTAILEDHTGTLWVGTRTSGLNRFDKRAGHFIRIQYAPGRPNGLKDNWITALGEDSSGELWVGAYGSSIARFDREKETFHYWQRGEKDVADWGFWYVHAILPDEKGWLWLGTEYGFYHFNSANFEYKRFVVEDLDYPLSNYTGANLIGKDKSGLLWINRFRAISRFNPETEEEFIYLTDSNSSDGLPATIVATLIDREGNLWLGGYPNGFCRLNKQKQQFQNFPSNLLSTEIARQEITSILEAQDGKFWFGSNENGLKSFDPKTGEVQRFQHDPNDPTSLPTNQVVKLYQDKEGTIWISLGNVGLGRVDKTTGEFHFIGKKRLNALRWIRAITEDQHGNLLLGTWGNLFYFDQETETYDKVTWTDPDGAPLRGIDATSLLLASDKRLWVGSNKGYLYYQEPDSKGFTHLTLDPENNGDIRFGKYFINDIYEDRFGNVWIATQGNGLWKINTVDKHPKQYQERDGLSGSWIGSIVEDDKGHLWISSDKGLIKFNIQTEAFFNFTIADGLVSNNLGGAFRSQKSSLLYFGSDKGLIAFHPDSIGFNPNPPPVFITSCEYFNIKDKSGQFKAVKGITEKKEIQLSYWDKILNFEFAALSYDKPEKNQYAYKLEGFNENWIQLGNKREVSFTNLNPGTYTLNVKGSNGDGIWNEKGISFKIIIRPLWYWSIWSKLLYLALFVAGLYYFYRFKVDRKLQAAETQRLRELDAVKTKLYTNITHEFRTPLTVISGMADQVKENPKEWFAEGIAMIKRNSSQLLNLVNQMLDLRKLESGSLKPKMIQGDVIHYLKYILESFHSYAETKDIRLHFLSDLPELVMDYDPEKTMNILSNLLSNAIKFTPEGGDVYVNVRRQESGDRSQSLAEHWLSGAEASQRQEPMAGNKKPWNNETMEPPPTSYHSSLIIHIKDTGIGIPVSQLPHIFDRFYQVDDSHTRQGEGTGIGLALTHELVKLLNGEISVKSRQGDGTEFTVILPITRNATLKSTAEPLVIKEKVLPFVPIYTKEQEVTTTQIGQDQRPLALVIEDNKDVVRYLEACLKHDYQVEVAENGQKGIDQAIETIPDIIISDVMMPLKDGFEVCQELKNDKRTSHIPIILLTAKADVASKIEGLERGADAYLPKPFDKTELLVRLAKLLELRKKLQQYYLQNSTSAEANLPEATQMDNLEHEFVKKVRMVIEDHLDDYKFNVEGLCREIGMSQAQLYRKLSALTGYSTNKFIRFIRLSHAQSMLMETDLPISTIAYDTGFNDPDYFSRIFKKEFGMTPSEFKEKA